MKIVDVRGKTKDELVDQLLGLRKEQFNLRFQQSTSELEKTARIRVVRRDIARIKTVLTELKQGVKVEAKAPKAAKAKAPKAEKKAAAKPAAKKQKKAV